MLAVRILRLNFNEYLIDKFSIILKIYKLYKVNNTNGLLSIYIYNHTYTCCTKLSAKRYYTLIQICVVTPELFFIP